MADNVLTPEQILDTTEDVLRRFGPAKATVVDVARAIQVSPGSIYRHFPTKAALREAVTHRWLERAHQGLAGIATQDKPAADRLREWLAALFDSKRTHSREEPELFSTFSALTAEHGDVAAAHVQDLTQQLRIIVAAGMERGEFAHADADAVSQALFEATTAFHNPLHVAEWAAADSDRRLKVVTELLIAGLVSGATF